MELRQLRHFVVLAEEMHFGRASKRLFMSQPALSSSLMRLEDELQLRLFSRDTKGVALTLAGRAMLTRVREIVSLTDKLGQFGQAMSTGRAGFIEVGFSASLLFRGLGHILTSFASKFPDIELSTFEYASQIQQDLLRNGRLDAAFINTPVAPAGLDSVVLLEERFVACLPETHPLAGHGHIGLELLRDDLFVTFSRDSSPAYYDHVIALCAAARFQPRLRAAASQLLTVPRLVATGLGVSLVPESFKHAGMAGTVYVPLRGVEKQPTAFLVWDPKREVPGLASLVETVRRAKTPP
jgi:DNA-binding transcriptional LysR family regulator